ncbi:MAG: hypothetical protein KDK63_01650, partial [Chlamydiia bacterium]|nr:hypothetical protein [Chlamydiia bacterium]
YEEAESKTRSEERDLEVLTFRFIEREPPMGAIIDLSTGKYRVDQTFSKGGGYMVLLRKIGEEERAILACRGTAGKWKATGGIQSVINNLLIEVGSRAVVENWEDIARYLKESGIRALMVCGKSQGGAHAQMLAPLIASKAPVKVSHVMTFASVGVSERICEIFRRVFNGSGTELSVYYNHGNLWEGEMDLIPYLGGRHVQIDGAKVYALSPKNSTYREEKVWFFWRIYYLLASFGRPHTRQNTLMDSYTKVPAAAVEPDPLFEMGRKCMAYLIHSMTFCLLNPVRYEEFYAQKREHVNVLSSCS